MLNIGLFELLFFIAFALIFLGPEKLLQLLKSVYTFYRTLKHMLNSVQRDLERELKLNELQHSVAHELSKLRDLEQYLSQKINADLKLNPPIYALAPYLTRAKIQSFQPHLNVQIHRKFKPYSYDLYNYLIPMAQPTFFSSNELERVL